MFPCCSCSHAVHVPALIHKLHAMPDLLLHTRQGEVQTIQIHVHNPAMHNPAVDTGTSTITQLREVLMHSEGLGWIVLGDFNLHHQHWGEDSWISLM